MRQPQNEREARRIANLLIRAQDGDDSAFDTVVSLVYDDLREIAHRHRSRWTGEETLGTTALVHEAYVKLAEGPDGEYLNRSHFLAVAARAMRQILVDRYRARRRQKRGGGASLLPLEKVDGILESFPNLSAPQEEAVLALHDALTGLGADSPDHARVIECRFFGGMTIAETADALGISSATVKRRDASARAWLAREIAGGRSTQG